MRMETVKKEKRCGGGRGAAQEGGREHMVEDINTRNKRETKFDDKEEIYFVRILYTTDIS